MSSYRYLFGPVPSRRLGRSLGIDLVPAKTCSFDCLFCQLGNTPATTLERREYVGVDAVLSEFARWCDAKGSADYLTLAGGGEPTLHSRFGDVLDGLGRMSPIPRAVLSNGSMFVLEPVRRDASRADVVKVSLSAWDQSSFETVNRPHPKVRFDEVYDGLRRFAAMFSGSLWVEVFVVPGLNDSLVTMRRIAALASALCPNRIHLNTAVRPAAVSTVRASTGESLEALSVLFDPVAELAVITEGEPTPLPEGAATAEDIAAMVARHPVTADQVRRAFGLGEQETAKALGDLCSAGQICTEKRGNLVYYRGGGARGS